jgi:DNA-binding transcriptional LysR family regulator
MRIFVAVAEGSSFAAAARQLGLSAPSVTRAVAALEERIGTQLLKRTTRTVRLTEAGTRFLADSRRLLQDVEEAERFASDLHGTLRGQLGVTASVNFGRLFVTPLVLEFLRTHTQASVRTLFVDRIVDLVDEGLDVAVRIAELPDSTLTGIRVGTVRRVLCASPEYLESHGIPRKPSDLADHQTIAFTTGVTEPEWTFARKGKRTEVKPHSRLLVNAVDIAIAAAVAGQGFTRLLSYQVKAEVRAGRLRIVLPEFEPPPIPVHVVHAGGKRASVKVRRFVDLAVDRLKASGFRDESAGLV